MENSYYQRSINAILSSVQEVHRELLLEEEHVFIELVLNLPCCPQRLFYRLCLRKPGWVRVKKLVYSDIESIDDGLDDLSEKGICEVDSNSVLDYLDQAALDELKESCKRLHISSSNKTKREDLVNLIGNFKVQKQQRLAFGKGSLSVSGLPSSVEVLRQICGRIVRIKPIFAEMFTRVTGLHFLVSSAYGEEGNNNLATAILTDLNKRRYPKYEIVRSRPIFKSRADWQEYEAAQELCNQVYEKITDKEQKENYEQIEGLVNDLVNRWRSEVVSVPVSEESCSQLPQQQLYFLRRFTAGWVLTRGVHQVTSWYEGRKMHQEAVELLESLLSQDYHCHGRRGQWWERLVLNLSKHLKQPEKAKSKCLEALKDPHVRTASRLSLRRRLAKLDKEDFEEFPINDIQIEGNPADVSTSGKKLVFQIDEDTTGSVESLVLHHFSNDGWTGLHTESSIFTTLYGILFWDIFFSPSVPDVFQTPFQAAPLDLCTDAFYGAREALIESRLAELRDHNQKYQIKERLVNSYNSNHGTTCYGVSWEYSLEDLYNVANAVGGPALAVIFKIFAEDYKNSRSGMPDLVLWRQPPNGPPGEETEHLLVEVKSVRDRLSDAQRHWAWIFAQHGICMVVCKVKHE